MKSVLITIVVACALGLCGCVSNPWGLMQMGSNTSLRVVSYNVALGMLLTEPNPKFRRLSREGTSIRAALLRHPVLSNFDVLGVQEICGPDFSPQLDTLTRIDEGLEVYFARADLERNGECRKGQAIVSRHPIVDKGVIRLPHVRGPGRAAIWADVAVGTRSVQIVRVYNVHLDNRSKAPMSNEEGRWRQIQPVLAHAMAWREQHPEGALILLGDLNTLETSSTTPSERERTLHALFQWMTPSLGHYENTHVLAFQTDWIFFQGLRLEHSAVVDLLLSDHYPVVADFAMKDLR